MELITVVRRPRVTVARLNYSPAGAAMAGSFDPYHKWLGIPPEDQPANYYRLLSINLFEDDATVVEEAADRQMAHVRTHQQGPHAAFAQKLLNEISAARRHLVNADAKARYDDKLRKWLAGRSGTGLKVAKAIDEGKPAPAPSRASPIPIVEPESTSILDRRGLRAEKKKKDTRPSWILPTVIGGSVVGVLLLIIVMLLVSDGDNRVADHFEEGTPVVHDETSGDNGQQQPPATGDDDLAVSQPANGSDDPDRENQEEGADDFVIGGLVAAGKEQKRIAYGKAIALAGLAEYEHSRRWPSDVLTDGDRPLLSWRVRLQKHVDRPSLAAVQWEKAWDSAENKHLLDKMPKTFASSESVSGRTAWKLLWRKNYLVPTEDDIVYINAGKGKEVPWTQPERFNFDPANPLLSLGEEPEGGYVVVFGGQSSDVKVKTLTADQIKDHFASRQRPIDDPYVASVDDQSVDDTTGESPAAPSEDPASSEEDAPELELTDLIEKIEPSVVRINVKVGARSGVGSGFVAHTDGTVVTNYHVMDGATSAEVVFRDGKTAPVLGFMAFSTEKDMALIRIKHPAEKLIPLRIAKDPPRKGEKVAAFGAPLGFSFTATEGIVSAVRQGSAIQKSFKDTLGVDVYATLGYSPNARWVQTSAPISGGNSGGPLVNMRGFVVGINTWHRPGGQNLNFAGATDGIREIMQKRASRVKSLADLPKSKRQGRPTSPTRPKRESGEEIPAKIARGSRIGEIHKFTHHEETIHDVAVSPNGWYLATASADKSVVVIELSTFEEVTRYKADVSAFTNVAFSPSAEILITGSTPGSLEKSNLRVWGVASGDELVNFTGRDKGVRGLAISPNGRMLVTTHDAGVADLRYFHEGLRRVNALLGADRNLPCHCATFSPDSGILAMCDGEGRAFLWSVSGRPRPAGDMTIHKGAVRTMAFSQSGKFLATAGVDATIRIWDNWNSSGEWRAVRQFRGHKGPVNRIVFSRDGSTLVSAGEDKRIRVWDLKKGKEQHEFRGHKSGVTSVAFLASGKYLVSGSRDGTARLWRLVPGKSSGTPSEKNEESVAEIRPTPPKHASAKIPTSEELTEAVKLINELLADDYSKAKRLDDKVELVDKLLKQASDETNAGTVKYALLSEAERIATEIGDVQLALDVTDEIISWFDVDLYKRRAATVTQLVKTARGSEQRTAVAEVALSWAGDAFASDQFPEALSFAAAAYKSAGKENNTNLAQKARREGVRIKAAMGHWKEYQQALSKLKADADDPDANLAAGRYLCFIAGNWQEGLAHLAKSSDERLKEIAKDDIRSPREADQQAALADRWRELADSADAADRTSYLAAARYWYEKALSSAQGLSKLRFQNELKKIGEIPSTYQRQ